MWKEIVSSEKFWEFVFLAAMGLLGWITDRLKLEIPEKLLHDVADEVVAGLKDYSDNLRIDGRLPLDSSSEISKMAVLQLIDRTQKELPWWIPKKLYRKVSSEMSEAVIERSLRRFKNKLRSK